MYLLDAFCDDAKAAAMHVAQHPEEYEGLVRDPQNVLADNPSFYDIAPALAHGTRALGYGKLCPRDGKPHCSIVDALPEVPMMGPLMP